MAARSTALGRAIGRSEVIGYEKDISKQYHTSKPKDDAKWEGVEEAESGLLLTPTGPTGTSKISRSNQVLKQTSSHANLIDRHFPDECPSEGDAHASSHTQIQELADKMTDFSEAMAAHGQRTLLGKDFLFNLELIEKGLSLKYLRKQITEVQKVQEVEQLHDFLTDMVRSQDESSSEVKLSTDGSGFGFADSQLQSQTVTEKNWPYTSLMTLLKERVL